MSLIHHYKFNELSGNTLIDYGSNAVNGTYVNTWTRNIDCPPGIGAKSSDGTNQYIQSGFDPSGMTSFTITGWFKYSTRILNTDIFSRDSATTRFRLFISGTGAPQLTIGTTGTSLNVVFTGSLESGTACDYWCYYALRWNGSSLNARFIKFRVAVNTNAGIRTSPAIWDYDTSTAMTGSIKTSANLILFGNNTSLSDAFAQIALNDFRVYDTVLTDTEIYDMATLPPYIRYRLDETSGTSYYSFNSYAASGSHWNGPTHVSALINFGTQYDGIDDYSYEREIGGIWHRPIVFTQSTEMIWFKTDELVTNANGRGIFTRYSDTGAIKTESGFIAGTNDGADVGKFKFRLAETSIPTLTLTSTNRVDDGQWHLFSFVRNAFSHDIYIDGVYQTSGTFTGTGYCDSAMQMGSSVISSPFDGKLDDYRYYPRMLTQSEIMDIYEEGISYLLCWNYTAKYKKSNRMYYVNGGGKFPSQLKVPSSVDTSSGIMIDEGKLISPDQYKIII